MRLKLPAVAVAAASLALAAGAAAAATPVYFTTYPAEGQYFTNNTLKVRPATLQMSGDASWIIAHVHWSSWGGATAQGTGVSVVERCTPTCAGGGVVTTRSTITLSHQRRHRGREMYECIAVVSRGPRSIATERANQRECVVAGLSDSANSRSMAVAATAS